MLALLALLNLQAAPAPAPAGFGEPLMPGPYVLFTDEIDVAHAERLRNIAETSQRLNLAGPVICAVPEAGKARNERQERRLVKSFAAQLRRLAGKM